MQLDDGLPDNNDIKLPAPVRPRLKPLPPISLRAFGSMLQLQVTSSEQLRDDSLWRLKVIYERTLAARTLATTGTALDIGAGFGCFAIPFALANRGWTIWAFEPEEEAFAALCLNIRAHKANNIVAVNAAVGGSAANEDLAVIRAAFADLRQSGPESPAAMTRLHANLPSRAFRRHLDQRGIIEIGPVVSDEFEALSFACLPAEALLELNPTLLKLTAPFAETAILQGLVTAPLDHVIGESWCHVPSVLVHGTTAGLRETWIPRAGDPLLRLRRTPSLSGHRAGLDVVVAMHDSMAWIKDCVDALLADGNKEVRVLVVDDGSTDGSREFVAVTYGKNDRVVLLSKENGGCASARNFGRLHSDASHIAFVDADDMAGPGLFSGLLELARHTGAELMQGGFELLQESAERGTWHEPSYEQQLPEIIHAHRHNMGAATCLLVPSWLLIQGQPSIWRRVYRRDYLDNRNIWFPEHIRAFDDQIFQLLTLQHVPDVPMLDGVHYLYRQHEKQDIRQGDERHFYSLEMFRLVLKRGVSEGWNDFRPVLASFHKTVNWCWSQLRADLRPAFERGAAELWAYAQATLDHGAFDGLADDQFAPPDFAFYVRGFRDKLRLLDRSYGSIYLDSIDMHPAMLKGPGKAGC